MTAQSVRAASVALVASALLAIAAPVVARGSSPSAEKTTTLRFTVPTAAVKAHATNVGPHAMSPGDGFQESYRPRNTGPLRRQDAIGIATYGRGMFLGSISVTGGQILYAGATDNQDHTSYAILGGTGRYARASGTVQLRPISSTRVRITLTVTG
ncbi:MAG TPA: hypothetical protein VMH41_02400 [Mycobacteriales bacterium]|nr:hypothetical protein [Mycobacteriales bacterium]